MMAGMIRSPHEHESAALVAIGVDTGLFSPAEAELLLAQTLADLHAGRLPDGHVAAVVVDAADVPLGWAYFAADDKASGVWNLWWIGVAPRAQGGGAGTALLAHVERHVQQQAGRVLVIETSASPALARTRAFYRRRGYRECGTIPDFYAAGDGKVIFARTFAPA